MSLFYCTCVVALWTISLKSCLSTYLLVDVLCINFNNVEGLSLFLLLVWGVVRPVLKLPKYDTLNKSFRGVL